MFKDEVRELGLCSSCAKSFRHTFPGPFGVRVLGEVESETRTCYGARTQFLEEVAFPGVRQSGARLPVFFGKL